MIYRQITLKEIVNIKCTLEEYNKKEFKSYLKCALASKVNENRILLKARSQEVVYGKKRMDKR